MRIAIFSDIHGNLPALTTVLADIEQQQVDRVLKDIRFEADGKRVMLVHGSPRRLNEYLFEDRPLSRPVRATWNSCVSLTTSRRSPTRFAKPSCRTNSRAI